VNDFDSLLPPRSAPPRLPSRGGPAAVLDAARSRRRRKATKVVGTGGALSVVFLGITVLRGPTPLHGIEEGPASQPPAASTTATASPQPTTAAPRASSPGDQPAGQDGPSPSPQPSYGTPGPTASPSALPPVPPLPTVDPSPPVRYVDVLRDEVADRPAEECLFHTSTTDPDVVLCTRQLGPVQVPSGTPVDFGYEVCAMTNDVTLRAPQQEEYVYRFLTGGNTGSGDVVWGARERPKGVGAHDYRVEAGTCIRYTFQWDGRGDNGQPLPKGSYHVEADIPGEWNIEEDGIDTGVRFTVT